MLVAVILVIFPFCMVYAAVSDMLSMTISNRVPVILVVSFAVIAPLTGVEWTTFGWHLAAGAIVLAVTFALFAIGGMGGGDAKLLAASAVWLGLDITLMQYLVYASIIGGALTIAILYFRNSVIADVAGGNTFLRHFADRKAGIPYGIALGIAGLIVYPDTIPMQWAIAQLAAV